MMDEQTGVLLARVRDALRISETRQIPKFVGFLSPAEATAAMACTGQAPVCLFGGYDGAERTVLGILPAYITEPQEAFPIAALLFTFPAQYVLSHRDVLGTLMSLGVKRESVGDICVESGRVVAFVLQDIAGYLAGQIFKIRNIGVAVTVVSNLRELQLQGGRRVEPLSFTVASARLDAVVSSLACTGRSNAEQMVSDGLVAVNSLAVTKPTRHIAQGDVLSIRGVGRFRIVHMGDKSKKGREIIQAEKYV